MKQAGKCIKHWGGLTVFLKNPDISMDNNFGENGLRGPIVGRKAYYGSQSIWSAELATALFTIFGTLKLTGINEHTWLLSYLHECAMLGGIPPTDVDKYLPWNMSTQQKMLFSCPSVHEEDAG